MSMLYTSVPVRPLEVELASNLAVAAGGGVIEWHGTFACTTTEAAQCIDGAQSLTNSTVHV